MKKGIFTRIVEWLARSSERSYENYKPLFGEYLHAAQPVRVRERIDKSR